MECAWTNYGCISEQTNKSFINAFFFLEIGPKSLKTQQRERKPWWQNSSNYMMISPLVSVIWRMRQGEKEKYCMVLWYAYSSFEHMRLPLQLPDDGAFIYLFLYEGIFCLQSLYYCFFC
jgi:hypothetical protein